MVLRCAAAARDTRQLRLHRARQPCTTFRTQCVKTNSWDKLWAAVILAANIAQTKRERAMPYATASDGVRLYYEEAGTGTPILFVHEFSGDLRSWEAQIQHFSRRYRCVAFNARGYPPSEVPTGASKYSHTIAVEDMVAMLRHLKIKKAHVMGCSMGAQSTL